jgi:hypothetical protein
MPASISYPSDPVTLGATAIQGTTFIPVAGDYEKISYAEAANRGLRMMRYMDANQLLGFPDEKTGASWIFFTRTDMPAGSGNANLIGVRARLTKQGHTAFSGTAGEDVHRYTNEAIFTVSAWLTAEHTTAGGDTYPYTRRVFHYNLSMVFDEAGNFLLGSGDEEAKAVLEALGFTLRPVAADYPVVDPAIKIFNGVSPLY